MKLLPRISLNLLRLYHTKKKQQRIFEALVVGLFLLLMKDTLTCSAWITETYVLFRAADIPVAFETIQPQNQNDDE